MRSAIPPARPFQREPSLRTGCRTDGTLWRENGRTRGTDQQLPLLAFRPSVPPSLSESCSLLGRSWRGLGWAVETDGTRAAAARSFLAKRRRRRAPPSPSFSPCCPRKGCPGLSAVPGFVGSRKRSDAVLIPSVSVGLVPDPLNLNLHFSLSANHPSYIRLRLNSPGLNEKDTPTHPSTTTTTTTTCLVPSLYPHTPGFPVVLLPTTPSQQPWATQSCRR